MENLNLGATTINTDLTSSNTNLSTTITASTFNSWKKTTTTTTTATNTAGEFVHIDGSDSYSANAYGTLYNFYATSAGTISGDTNSNNAEHDICPAGWRLASVGELRNLYTYYNSNSAMRSSIANNGAAFVITGYFTPGSAINYNQSKTSYYWSSTVKSDTAMDGLTLNDTTVWTTSQTLPRNRHYPIRCVFKESETNPVTVLYDQGVTEVRIDNVVVADGDTIVLSGGTPHTISMTTTSDFLPGTFVVTSGVVNNNGGTTTYTTGTQAATLTANSIFNATYIQDIYTQECTSTATTVYDSRDLQAYRVKRLADGNCWMIDNLNLGAKPLKTHLTLQNTNINFSINSSVFNSWKKTAGTQNFTDGEIIPVEGTDSVSGNRYGTPKSYVEELRNQGKNVILEIEINGAEQVLKKVKDDRVISFFLKPPSLKQLEERIRKRKSENEETIQKRLNKGKAEMEKAKNYDFIILNDRIKRAGDEIISIIKKFDAE